MQILRANTIIVGQHVLYRQIMDTIIGDTRTEHMRVGVYGIWTSIKVEYLILSLQTLPPFFPPEAIGV